MDSEIDINNGLDMELSSMLKLKLWNDLAYKRNLLTISLCKSRRLREEANASLDVMDESEDMIPESGLLNPFEAETFFAVLHCKPWLSSGFHVRCSDVTTYLKHELGNWP
ncbi:hypothetical protein LWI28_000827 [Acer negundo]|uniref:Uncharacterized protein n=1 Tax=Acer negundo TaxID=4023 RepID=A0AAD5J721_ACENE|nr:hypothetical protein LWI28_000827 [Acer negundo]